MNNLLKTFKKNLTSSEISQVEEEQQTDKKLTMDFVKKIQKDSINLKKSQNFEKLKKKSYKNKKKEEIITSRNSSQKQSEKFPNENSFSNSNKEIPKNPRKNSNEKLQLKKKNQNEKKNNKTTKTENTKKRKTSEKPKTRSDSNTTIQTTKEKYIINRKRKNSVLKYNLLENKTYTYGRLKHEKMLFKQHKSALYNKRYDHWGTEINDKKNHKIFFNLKKMKVDYVDNWKKFNMENSHVKKCGSCSCVVF